MSVYDINVVQKNIGFEEENKWFVLRSLGQGMGFIEKNKETKFLLVGLMFRSVNYGAIPYCLLQWLICRSLVPLSVEARQIHNIFHINTNT